MKNLNRKGFTLVEVLAVVVIIGLLAALLIPNVNTLLKRQQDNSYQDIEKMILISSKEYVGDNRYGDVPEELCVNTLIEEGYLKEQDIKNPKDGSSLNKESTCVKVNYDENKKDYIIKLINGLVW